MKNKLVSLYDMVQLVDDAVLSEKYIRYICGLGNAKQYRHQEIETISSLLQELHSENLKLDGFIFDYDVLQLNREFDLLKITEKTCLDIELKSKNVSPEKIKTQLLSNKHYLRLLNKSNLFLFTYVEETNKLWFLDEDDHLGECEFDTLEVILKSMEESDAEALDLDGVFSPENILISPLNAPDRFLTHDYLLTEHQENIKKKILTLAKTEEKEFFVGITGGPGTGKTLLVYDLACTFAQNGYNVLIVHSGILCEGHFAIEDKVDNLRVLSAKGFKSYDVDDVDIIVVDEAQRLHKNVYEKIIEVTEDCSAVGIFSFDDSQTLSKSEEERNIAQKIEERCCEEYKLKGAIRTNKELLLFITCLRDLSKFRPKEYTFPGARVIFEPDKIKAVERAKKLKNEGYTFISYTPSMYNWAMDYQEDEYNTHNVIGQEFDSVCMILDEHFYYNSDGVLKATCHPNPDYIFEKLLYQGLTRVRSRIAVIVTTKDVLSKVLPLMKNT